MSSGTVESIYIAAAAEGTPQSVGQATAIPGAGLEGDRSRSSWARSTTRAGFRAGVWIEAEAIEALKHDYQVEVPAGDARRNIVTRNVPLNHLVGREFAIGMVRIRGIRLCEPCDHLERVTGKAVIKGLLHRGGLRAQILTPGTIHVGDKLTVIQ